MNYHKNYPICQTLLVSEIQMLDKKTPMTIGKCALFCRATPKIKVHVPKKKFENKYRQNKGIPFLLPAREFYKRNYHILRL